TMGEFMAWIIGWALILEYALASATVSIAWSQYLNNLFGGTIPYAWCHAPLEYLVNRTVDGKDMLVSVTKVLPTDTVVNSGIVNIPAVIILLILTLILITGTPESAFVHAIIVFVKVTIVLLFIGIGWQFMNEANHTPFFIPEGLPDHESWRQHGWGGVFGGAAIVFFAFIGFDAVSTAAQEAKNPKRDMPIGILGSLVFCT